jgi:rare lipoprotein A
MVMTRKSGYLNLKTPLRFYLLVGVSSVALAVVVFLLATRTVHADARLRPTQTPDAEVSVTGPTPATLAKLPVGKKLGKLHGIASWYGGVFHGRKTASGEQFDMNAMTACHPTLPFGSMVRVVNLHNHLSVIVRITDRGDLINEGRVIDLSYGAAQKLAMVNDGLAPVELQVLSVGNGRTEQ